MTTPLPDSIKAQIRSRPYFDVPAGEPKLARRPGWPLRDINGASWADRAAEKVEAA